MVLNVGAHRWDHHRKGLGEQRDLGGGAGTDLAIGVDRPRPSGADRHATTTAPMQNVRLGKTEFEVGDARDKLPERTWQDEIDMESSIIDGRMFCDRQPSAMVTTVPDADLVGPARPGKGVIDGEFDIERARSDRHAQKTDRVR